MYTDKNVCKNCGSPDRLKERRLCRPCNNKRANAQYYKTGKATRRKPDSNCQICDKPFKSWRETQVICPNCYKQSLNTGFEKNQYKIVGNRCEHRVIAEQVLNRKLSYNEVVHHVDEDIHNNSLENLWVMSRHQHGRLHRFLRLQRVAYEKSLGSMSVNCWDILRVNQTTAWLEMTGAKVIKLVELDNQQPSK